MVINMADESIARREFLKLVAATGGALVLGRGAYKFITEAAKLFDEEGVNFVEIPHNETLPFKTPDSPSKPQPVTIQYMPYKGDFQLMPLRLRAEKDEKGNFSVNPVPFSPGAKNERYPGEIIEAQIKQYRRSPRLSPDITVGIWLTPLPHFGIHERVSELKGDQTIFGIPVISSYVDLVGDGQPPPFETSLSKKRNRISQEFYYPKYGMGAVVGRYQMVEKGERQLRVFTVKGYVQDISALSPVV
jgi:hypothetical protein